MTETTTSSSYKGGFYQNIALSGFWVLFKNDVVVSFAKLFTLLISCTYNMFKKVDIVFAPKPSH